MRSFILGLTIIIALALGGSVDWVRTDLHGRGLMGISLANGSDLIVEFETDHALSVKALVLVHPGEELRAARSNGTGKEPR